MEIYDRAKNELIEGFSKEDLSKILRNDNELINVDSVIFNSMLLSDGKMIRCIRSYYAKKDGSTPRVNKRDKDCCSVQKFYSVSCTPYECRSCHLKMIQQRYDKLVKPR